MRSPYTSPSLWERCRNVPVWHLVKCNSSWTFGGCFFPIWKTCPANPCALLAQWLLLSAACSHVTFPPPGSLSRWGRGVRSAAPRLLWQAYGWHEIDRVIGRSSRVVIRHGWLMLLLCVGGFTHTMCQWAGLREAAHARNPTDAGDRCIIRL